MWTTFHEFCENLFLRGIREDDILWFIDRNNRTVTKNCSFFAIALAGLIFCGTEVICQLYLLTKKPALEMVMNFGPMFFASLHVFSAILPFILQRYEYKQIFKDYRNLWPLKVAKGRGLEKIRKVFTQSLSIVIFYVFLASACGIGYFPLTGLDYEKSVFPVISALQLIEDRPKSILNLITAINFAMVLVKAFFMAAYGWLLMHLTMLYIVQNILLRERLSNITYDKYLEKADPLNLVEEKCYQKWVQNELKECIELDIKLKKFSVSLIDYFRWVLLIHVGNAIAILTTLYYIIAFMNGGSSPVGAILFMVGAHTMATLYAYYSETFYEQVFLNRRVLSEIPWYTFNLSNRRMLLLFLCNLSKSRYLSASGVFDVNFALLIFVMHKSINFLTVLGQMTDK